MKVAAIALKLKAELLYILLKADCCSSDEHPAWRTIHKCAKVILTFSLSVIKS